jgi:hypothetical protein
MDFRSHFGRPFDFRQRSNVILAVIVVVTGATAAVLWVAGDPATVLWAPVHAFVIWALIREIDPDHQWPAIVGALMAGAWVLQGMAISPIWAPAGLIVAARITTSTTGRRLLPVDLGVVSGIGIAIGFTVAGWAAGFGIALALHLDDRFRGESRLPAIAASAITAIGTTVVATAAGAFPDTAPAVVQYLAIIAGLAALTLLAREPAVPTSTVDARHGAFLDRARLHTSRSIVGVLVFLMTILTGAEAEGLVVVIGALWLAVISNEIELIRRRGR